MKKNIKIAFQNLKTHITLIVMIMFCTSCQEIMITKDFTSDLELITAIQNAENKVITSMNSLPEESKIAINTIYSSNYISKSELAPELGYQVDLRKYKGRQVANKSVAYFDIDGRMLIAEEDFKAKQGGRGGKKGNRKKKDLEDCFDFIYPFTFTMPDASKIEISDAKGWDFVKAWYKANPEEEDRPIFVFPLNILVEESEMIINDDLSANLIFDDIPIIEYAKKYFEEGVYPSGSQRNFNNLKDFITFENEDEALLLSDAQTSGGLLIAAPKETNVDFSEIEKSYGVTIREIGNISDRYNKKINIISS